MEICYCCTLAVLKASFNVAFQGIPRPTSGYSIYGIPLAFRRFCLGEQCDNVEPRQLVSRLLTKLRSSGICLGPRGVVYDSNGWTVFSKESHVFDVTCGETFDVRKCRLQVGSDFGNDLRAPTLMDLALQNIPSNAVIESNNLGIYRKGGTASSGMDANLDLGEPCCIVRWNQFRCHFVTPWGCYALLSRPFAFRPFKGALLVHN